MKRFVSFPRSILTITLVLISMLVLSACDGGAGSFVVDGDEDAGSDGSYAIGDGNNGGGGEAEDDDEDEGEEDVGAASALRLISNTANGVKSIKQGRVESIYFNLKNAEGDVEYSYEYSGDGVRISEVTSSDKDHYQKKYDIKGLKVGQHVVRFKANNHEKDVTIKVLENPITVTVKNLPQKEVSYNPVEGVTKKVSIRAVGGSGEYEWHIDGQSKESAKFGEIKKNSAEIEITANDLGEYAFALSASDADPDMGGKKSEDAEFSFTVKQGMVVNVNAMFQERFDKCSTGVDGWTMSDCIYDLDFSPRIATSTTWAEQYKREEGPFNWDKYFFGEVNKLKHNDILLVTVEGVEGASCEELAIDSHLKLLEKGDSVHAYDYSENKHDLIIPCIVQVKDNDKDITSASLKFDVIGTVDGVEKKETIDLSGLSFSKDPGPLRFEVDFESKAIDDDDPDEPTKRPLSVDEDNSIQLNMKNKTLMATVKIIGGQKSYRVKTNFHDKESFRKKGNKYVFEFSGEDMFSDSKEITFMAVDHCNGTESFKECQGKGSLEEKVFNFLPGCEIGEIGTIRLHAKFAKSSSQLCNKVETTFNLGVDGHGWVEVDNYLMDVKGNNGGSGDGKIDDLSPYFNMTAEEGLCVEDISRVQWYFDGYEGCGKNPTVYLDAVLIEWCPPEVNSKYKKTFVEDGDCIYAGWNGNVGRAQWGYDDLAEEDHYFDLELEEILCSPKNEVDSSAPHWCEENPFEKHYNWKKK